MGEKGEGRREGEEKGNGKKILRELNSQDGGRKETEGKVRDILVEGAIMEIARKLALDSRITRTIPGKTLCIIEEGA